jgi:dihydrofolate reductase
MRRIAVSSFITLDGIMQAPGRGEDDFEYGGWSAPYFAEADTAAEAFMIKHMASADLLLGRITFELFASYWPTHGDLWPGVNDVTKYVVSNTINENKTDWKNTVFLKNVDDIRKLRESEGSDLHVHGSGNLIQTLLRNDLVDVLWLKIFPITLGTGKRLFDNGTIAAAFRLTDSLITSNGVIFANYERAGNVTTGIVG